MKNEHTPIIDGLDRPLRDLRLSVTDRCNFRCRYCMPAEIFGPDYPFLAHDKLLSFEEMERLVRIFTSFGVKKLRITGGEPLLRKNLPSFIARIRDLKEIEDIAITTNGVLLKKYARELKEAGLDRVTVSLDCLDDERFGYLNGRGMKVQPIIEGMDAAAEAGLTVKVNLVVQKGVNDKDILPMAKFFKDRKYTLRFIEFMDVGNSNGWKLDHVVHNRDILKLIHDEMPLKAVSANYYGEVAKRYRYLDSEAEIGFISSVTQAFCSTCTRARMSAEGSLYTCLFATEGTDLRTPIREGLSDEEIKEIIQNVWLKRQDRYSEVRLSHTKLPNRKIEMSHIGG